MEHIVYISSDLSSGKFYIGKHTKVKNDSYVGSGVWVKNCKKAGIKLKFDVVAKCQTEKDAYDFEHKLVVSCKKQYPNLCMNFSDGGVGFYKGQNIGRKSPMFGKKHSESSKAQIGLWAKQNKAGTKHHMYGKSHSEETKAKMSKSHYSDKFKKGKAVLCIETGVVYPCLADASRAVSKSADGRNNIRKYCQGKTQNKIYGYTWKFV